MLTRIGDDMVRKLRGAGAHACDPRTSGGQGERTAGVQEFESSLGNAVRPCLYKN